MKRTKRQLPKSMYTFLDYQMACCKASTVNTYRTKLAHFNNYLEELYQTKKIYKKHLANLTKDHLQGYIIYLNRKNLAPATKMAYFVSIRKYLIWEMEQGTIRKSLFDAFDRQLLPKIPEYLPKPLSFDNDRYLIDRWRRSNNPYSKIFLLLRFTGLRIGEIIDLPTDCIVTNHNNEKYLKVPLGKLDNERIIPINEEIVSLINNIKVHRQFIAGLGRKADHHRLIGIRGNSKYVYNHLKSYFIKEVKTLTNQNNPITFHRLRHTYATTLLTAGMSIVSLMKLLGHRKIQMSLRYAMVTPSHLRKEYLSAIKTLESKCVDKQEGLLKDISQTINPSHLILKLRAYADKAAKLDHKQKKVLLRRLSRLQHDLENIEFGQSFKLKSEG